MRLELLICLSLIIAACDTSGVKNTKTPDVKKVAKTKNILDEEHKVVATKKLSSGISIQWYEQGKGDNLAEGDLVSIDFKVKIKDGTVVDGNHLLNKESLPFLVGFGLQTPGWEIALKEMKVGDFARVLIPSKLARGSKGVEGLIPPNADNLLYIRILKKEKPDRIVDGTKVWILEENKDNKLKFNNKTNIIFHGMASTPSNAMYVNTFRTNKPFTYRLADHGLVPGLRKALINAKKSDRLYIVVPPSEAYGNQGYLDFVKPNESIFYNVLVMDVVK
jgi:FKBP-type peptidyl-prolyl cis-trans isomerase